MADNVIHLAFRNPKLQDDTMAFLSCVACRNKTFVFIQDNVDGYPLMKCAACGDHIGRMGWAHEAEAPR